jgi:D-alanyl-D-alanine carboxypeptidase
MNKRKAKIIFQRQRLAILILVAFILLLIIIFSAVNSNATNRRVQAEEEIERLEQTIEELERVEIPPEVPWNLQLINEHHLLPEGFTPTLTEVNPYFSIDSRVVEHLISMLNEAQQDGAFLNMTAAHISYERQVEIFVARMLEMNNAGFNLFDSYHEASNLAFIPGSSEHQAGLAVAFGPNFDVPYGHVFNESTEIQWLEANAHRFGFIRRFPVEAVEITGVGFAPYQWRFVGISEAGTINSQGITLEQYLQREFNKELN